jgi:transposase
VEKKFPEKAAALIMPEKVKVRNVRLMFQDEARFGRMVRIRRCWAPEPSRPSVENGYEREFVYVYGAVSPIEGEMDWMISPKMNTGQMGCFLLQISTAHPDDFIIMVLDGASSHKSKDLQKPENIHFVPLPSYSPELNPQEHVWDELREKEFPNRVFNNMEAVVKQLEYALPILSADKKRLQSLTAWHWIISLNLKAN